MSYQQVRDFFAVHQARPKKQLGQNFLVNPEIRHIILDAGELADTDTVVEIGAGLGYLTSGLAAAANRVIAVEVDRLLYKALAAQFGTDGGSESLVTQPTHANVELMNADILKVDLRTLLTPAPCKVIANLPYNITTPILWKLLECHEQMHSCVLMMQKEVAERIVAEPGGKDYGAMTLGVAYHAEATLIATLSPENFYPAPKVESAILKLTMRDVPKVRVKNEDFFFKVIRTAFRTRRKMLKNSLSGGRLATASGLAAAFQELGIAPERRAETLDLTEFAALANFLSTAADS